MSDSAGSQPPLLSGSQGAPFIRHLDDLYAFAQALTLDDLRAADLVEETCRRGTSLIPGGLAAEEERRRLFEILIQAHRARSAQTATGRAADGGAAPPADAAPAPLHRRLAEQFLSGAVPVAVAGLPDDLRAVLLLSDAEDIPCARAAPMLGLAEEDACARLEQARVRVRESVDAGATDAERRLLQRLPEDWLPYALKQVLRSQFTPPPDALRMSVANIVGLPEREEVRRESDPEAAAGWHPQRPSRVVQRRAQSRERGVLVAAVLILTTGLLGLLAARYVRQSSDRSLVTLAARQAENAVPEVRTDRPEEAEAYVQEELGLRLTLPEIEGAALEGVGVAELTPDVEVPVFLYQDATAETPLVLYAISYALLDRSAERVSLDPGVLTQIEEEARFDLHDLGAKQVLVWRNRDDIFLAVTWGDAGALQARILFPA